MEKGSVTNIIVWESQIAVTDRAQHKFVFCVSSFEDNNVDNINIFSKMYELFN